MDSVNNTPNLVDYITIAISLGALVISGVTVFFTCRANRLSKEANDTSKEANNTSKEATRIANGEIEISIGNSIRSTQQRSSDIAMKIAEISTTEVNNKDLVLELRKAYDQAVEANLNAYDEACALYVDGKIDTKRFKRNYHSSIKALVEDDELRKRYFDAVISRYECILKVYQEWHKLEK